MSAARDHRRHGLWELGAPPLRGDWDEIDRREALAEGRRMLARRAHDRGFVATLRRTLATHGVVGRLDDHEVIAVALRMLDRGQLQVRFRARVVRPFDAPQSELEPAIGPSEVVEVDDLFLDVEHVHPGNDLALTLELPPPADITVEAEHAGTPATFGDGELEAQASVLRDAAAAGMPFCEECEKARLAAEQEAAQAAAADSPTDDALAGLDAAAQADTMRSAAASGAPFCEECERAKAAAAKGDS
jgi:hypothetical protein